MAIITVRAAWVWLAGDLALHGLPDQVEGPSWASMGMVGVRVSLQGKHEYGRTKRARQDLKYEKGLDLWRKGMQSIGRA